MVRFASVFAFGWIAVAVQCSVPDAATTEKTVFCTLIGCVSGFAVSTHLSLGDGSTSESVTITGEVCRNDGCDAFVVTPHATKAPTCVVYGTQHSDCRLSQRADRTWTLLLSRFSGEHADGDGLRLTVRRAPATTILDVTRRISYDPYQPNGPECEPTCWGGGAYFLSASQSALTCTSHTCVSGLHLTAHAQTLGKQLHVCRNQFCADVDTSQIDRSSSFVFGLKPLDGEARIAPSRTAGYDVDLQITALPDELADGDHYRISTGQTLLFDQSVSYLESYPNGPSCDLLPCRQATGDVP